MSFSFTVSGQGGSDSHNEVIRAAFKETLFAVRERLPADATVEGSGYSDDGALVLFQATDFDEPVSEEAAETPTKEAAEADEPNATDAAVAHAEATGINLSDVTGTGRDGRITKSDVQAHDIAN